MLIVFFLQKKLLVGHFSDLKQVHCNGCFTLARTPHVELNLTPFFGETWKWELEINLGPMDWELLEGCSSYFPSPTWKQGAIYIQHFGLPPNTRLFPPMLFLEVSVIISDDLYEMLVLFGSLPLTKKYIHHNLFSLGKNLSALFGAVIFWSKTWNQGITCWFLSWDPADFADVFAPKPSIKKCSAPTGQQKKLGPVCSVGEKKGQFPTVQNTGWRSSFGDQKRILLVTFAFLCKALALAEEQYLRLQKCWWRIGWKWLKWPIK